MKRPAFTNPSVVMLINNGSSFQTNPSFTNLAAGSVTGIVVKNGNGCKSVAISCSASNCTAARLSDDTENEEENAVQNIDEAIFINDFLESEQPIVKVAPNPFNDQIEFKVFTPQSGNGSIEIFTLNGQKIATVYSGEFNEGENQFKVSLPKLSTANVIYRLVIDGKQVTGKLLQFRDK